ncbi:orotate phosphoribosyltransferase [Nicoliella spurrieriana]|uniref:Orotate phosphoribosyltransferase n=1 Tax=Nicoliella spurrieriana TaxID=2925830 RepID=A0A976RSR6_9LACO|nr:orotate phosphoribosyltransferase [Nicoliella spurrieriana]UQS87222.1 orotate phosphoribosyltransferase [Nicoliella spurrieriana]
MALKIEKQIASGLLRINAVTLSPKQPFTWASGIKSPIYTDNRLTIGYPALRTQIADGLANMIKVAYPEATVIGGVATAGIPHAALVADRLNLPMVYVRSKPKDHGQGRQIEGHLPNDAKVVLIDDLISTGGSVLDAAKAVDKEAAAKVIGVAAIFTYELADSTKNFGNAKIPLTTLTNYSSLITQAKDEELITPEDHESLVQWRENPWSWGK